MISDGRGGLKVHLERGAPEIVKADLIAHEKAHIEDIKARALNLDILNDPSTADHQILIRSSRADQFDSEIRGHSAAIAVWQSQLKSASSQDAIILNDRIRQSQLWIYAYRNPL